jgi:hypothetical protein
MDKSPRVEKIQDKRRIMESGKNAIWVNITSSKKVKYDSITTKIVITIPPVFGIFGFISNPYRLTFGKQKLFS